MKTIFAVACFLLVIVGFFVARSGLPLAWSSRWGALIGCTLVLGPLPLFCLLCWCFNIPLDAAARQAADYASQTSTGDISDGSTSTMEKEAETITLTGKQAGAAGDGGGD